MVCVNCMYFHESFGDHEMCGGRRPCLNYAGEYEKNYFEPDRDYVKQNLSSCDNCGHNEEEDVCRWCVRNQDLEDRWETEEVDA